MKLTNDVRTENHTTAFRYREGPDVRGFGISNDEMPAFSLLCALLHAGYDTPFKIVEQAHLLSGDRAMLNVAHILDKYVGWPTRIFEVDDYGTIRFGPA
ncbi:hypothetical protein [Novosphingobium album (ex Hu et al. 2023)]|uniref:Uncharacterized protein n=1 Tax=Novosphingobium album (ex Hu et al. 2023) TaxID=2930093 RepID=A0ABT0B0J9_9SPHN|nr:hypothetical protein [Novosphingobium album (ex Hu et al. 2023)]MCJ2178597.1 hypothetical protein [Novosphingobium album (ex Hu et al. 2023)]